MPAVTLALAEIEERLEEIRYRINLRSLIAFAAPTVGVLLGLTALLVWSAARATPDSFSISLYAGIVLAVVLTLWSALALWRRWLTLEHVARLADERGCMQQRLTTALWLAHRPVQPPLAPLLVADTVDRRDAWRAAAIVPRRFPFELGYPLAGAIALAVALFLARRLPPEADVGAQQAKAPHPLEQQRQDNKARPQPPRESGDESLLEPSAEGMAGGGRPGGELDEDSTMSEQLRKAIRQALSRQKPDDQGSGEKIARADLPKTDLPPKPGLVNVLSSKQGGGEGRRDDGVEAADLDGAQARGEGGEGGEQRRANDAGADRGKDDGSVPLSQHQPKNARQPGGVAEQQPGEKQPQKSKPGTDAPPEANQQAGESPGENEAKGDSPKQDGQAHKATKPGEAAKGTKDAKGDAKGNQQGGQRASGGDSGDSGGLFAKKGSGGAQLGKVDAGTSTFKLTLGSFLSGGGRGDEKPKSGARTSANGRAAVAEPPSLNPNQTADDALRRADIPIEYEDIVRRIYSARPVK